MKTLLAIINRPEESKSFIKYAANLAIDLKLKLHLIFVQNPEAYPLGAPGTTGTMTVEIQKGLEEMAENAQKSIEELTKEVKSEIDKDLATDVTTEVGVPKFIVEELVDEDKVHMVIVDSKEDVSFWEQNSNNMDIIYDVNCPVWVIPFESVYKPYNKVVYATNYKEEDINTLKQLVSLTKPYNPEIVALHITDSTEFEEKVKTTGFSDTVKSKTGYEKIAVEALLERKNDNVSELINDYSKDIDANLITVLKENRHFLERLFKSSATKKLIKEAQLPVLVFHEKE